MKKNTKKNYPDTERTNFHFRVIDDRIARLEKKVQDLDAILTTAENETKTSLAREAIYASSDDSAITRSNKI